MDIDPRIAQTIVENIKGVIRHDINFFDAHGKMIASTDATRIGTFHDAARLAAERKRTVAVDGDNQFTFRSTHDDDESHQFAGIAAQR